MHLGIALTLILGLAIAIVSIIWRKFPYLKKLPIDMEQKVGVSFFSDFFPELHQSFRRFDLSSYQSYFLRELEKFLRRLKVASLKLERLANSLIRKIKTNDYYTNGNGGGVGLEKQVAEPVKVFPVESEVNYKKEEQSLIIEIAKDPKNPELYRRLADVYFSMKNFVDAVESLEMSLKLDSEDEKTKEKLTKAQKMLLALRSSGSDQSEVGPM